MNYIQLQTAALDALIDTPTIVSNAVPRLVNQAILELEERFNFQVMQANASYTTTTDSHTLTPGTLPADFKQFRGRPYYKEFYGGTRSLEVSWDREFVLRRWGDLSDVDTADPRILLVDEGLEVWPRPDGISDYTDGQYRITLPYWKFLPDLVNNTDTNWFTINTPQYIINWVVAEGFAIDWGDGRDDKWDQRAEKEALRAILTGKRQYLSGFDTFVPHQGALDGPSSGR